jgi:hypothetical protein
MSTPARQEDAASKVVQAPAPAPGLPERVTVGLSAAIFAMRDDEPMVAIIPPARCERVGDGALPCGPFSPREHATLEAGLATWVQSQTGIALGATRQLCTVGDRLRVNATASVGPAVLGPASLGPASLGPASVGPASLGPASLGPVSISICYLALLAPAQCSDQSGVIWRSWYAYLPWEDWRRGKPACLTQEIEPRLIAWSRMTDPTCAAPAPNEIRDRSQRLRIAFGLDGAAWDEEKVLERYELLCEAGLTGPTGSVSFLTRLPRLQHPLTGDHNRLLANAVGELRRRIKWQPVIFELMADTFTLYELQKTVEAILGPHLHKQNFRRLVEAGGLVEPTGEHRLRTGGRPARLFRFRPDVLLERLAPGVRVKSGRA